MLFQSEISQNPENFKRLSIKYVNCSDRFKLQSNTDYTKQFAHLYAKRLNEMRSLLTNKINEKWGNQYSIKKMSDLREEEPEKCVLIGTLYVHQKLKPSILHEISEESQLVPQPVREKFVDNSDIIILEDELQRIRLIGKMDPHKFVTGIVCAILGYTEADGKFNVEDCLFYECGPQKPLKDLSVSPLLVIMSGLDQSSTQDFTLSLELFQQWIFGNLSGIDNNVDFEAANIVRVIIAGNSVRSSMEIRQKSLIMRQPESVLTLKAVQAVDELMSSWSKSIYVDLMPGEFDPANFMLPQQPMHPCMFPQSGPCGSFQSVTNPYECMIEDRIIFGTSGQNISNIQKYSNINDPMEALKCIARWSHIAPTCPDTLGCYPYTNADPFIINNCPHILFAGNTSAYKTDDFIGDNGKKIKLVCVPSFSETKSVAVINLKTLECKQLNFDVNIYNEIEP